MGFQPMLEAAASLFKRVWSASPTLDVGTVASHGDWPSGFLDCLKFGEVAKAPPKKTEKDPRREKVTAFFGGKRSWTCGEKAFAVIDLKGWTARFNRYKDHRGMGRGGCRTLCLGLI